MQTPFPASWREALEADLSASYFERLSAFVDAERRAHEVFPPEDDVFRAFELTPREAVRAVILGQDPYHGPGQAEGLAFSVAPGVPMPPSLANVLRERQADLGLPIPKSGSLIAWARRGVLLLNTVLTVRAHKANSHRDQGWETFTDRVLAVIQAGPPVVFVLWGGPAKQKAAGIDTSRHGVVLGAHPSPLSANKGFFGTRPFSRVNALLRARGLPEIDWRLEGD